MCSTKIIIYDTEILLNSRFVLNAYLKWLENIMQVIRQYTGNILQSIQRKREDHLVYNIHLWVRRHVSRIVNPSKVISPPRQQDGIKLKTVVEIQ
jgi:hypothetical protein